MCVFFADDGYLYVIGIPSPPPYGLIGGVFFTVIVIVVAFVAVRRYLREYEEMKQDIIRELEELLRR